MGRANEGELTKDDERVVSSDVLRLEGRMAWGGSGAGKATVWAHSGHETGGPGGWKAARTDPKQSTAGARHAPPLFPSSFPRFPSCPILPAITTDYPSSASSSVEVLTRGKGKQIT